MRIERTIVYLLLASTLAACGASGDTPEQVICREELERKAQGSEMQIETINFSGASKDPDGNEVVSGQAQLLQNGKSSSMPFRCVMQGTGESATIMRAEFTYADK